MVSQPRGRRDLRYKGKSAVHCELSDNEEEEEEQEYRGEEDENSQQTPVSLRREPENIELVIENDLTADIAEILVGEGAVFYIHKSLLVEASPYFAHLVGILDQSKPIKFDLLFEHPTIFAILAKSMYLGHLNLLEFPKIGKVKKDAEVEGRPFYVNLQISIERYELKKFEEGLEAWWDHWVRSEYTAHLSDDLMEYAYVETKPGSILRSFLLDVLVQVVLKNPASIDDFKNCATKFPEIGIELARALAVRSKPPAKKQRLK